MKLIGEQDYIIFHHTMCIQSSTSCEIIERIHIEMIKYHTISPLTNFHSFKGTIGCLLFPTRSLGKRRGFAENPNGFQGTEGITHCIPIWHRPLLVNRGGLELWLWRDDFLRHWLIFSVAFIDLRPTLVIAPKVKSWSTLYSFFKDVFFIWSSQTFPDLHFKSASRYRHERHQCHGHNHNVYSITTVLMVPMGPYRPHIFRRRPENQDASLFLFWKGGVVLGRFSPPCFICWEYCKRWIEIN